MSLITGCALCCIAAHSPLPAGISFDATDIDGSGYIDRSEFVPLQEQWLALLQELCEAKELSVSLYKHLAGYEGSAAGAGTWTSKLIAAEGKGVASVAGATGICETTAALPNCLLLGCCRAPDLRF